MEQIQQTIQNYYDQYPIILPLICIAIGVFFLLAAIFNWNWIFGDVSPSTYDLKKIDGWINIFGRKTARIVASLIGIFIIFIGILLTCMLVLQP